MNFHGIYIFDLSALYSDYVQKSTRCSQENAKNPADDCIPKFCQTKIFQGKTKAELGMQGRLGLGLSLANHCVILLFLVQFIKHQIFHSFPLDKACLLAHTNQETPGEENFVEEEKFVC